MPNNSILGLLNEAIPGSSDKILDAIVGNSAHDHPHGHSNQVTPTLVLNPGLADNGGGGTPFVVGAHDCYIGVLTGNNLTCEITLPNPDDVLDGQFYYISDVGGLADVCPITVRAAGINGQPIAQDRIMGNQTIVLTNKWESIRLICIVRSHLNGIEDRMWIQI